MTSTEREVKRSAVFSPDGRYRYVLGRRFVERPTVPLRLCVWCNPSTADDKEDDASIRVGLGYAWRWGDGGIVVINIGDLVETDSTKLPADPLLRLGPDHWERARSVLDCRAYGALHPDVLCGWGDIGAGPLAEQMVGLLRKRGFHPMALALTKQGNPGHPLRKSAELTPVPFQTPLEARLALKLAMKGRSP